MRFFRRSLVALGLAATLPTVVFAAFSVFYLLRLESERVETATLVRSRMLTTLIDAQVQQQLAALRIVATSPSLERGDVSGFQRRAQRILDANPQWRTIALLDVERRNLVFDLALPQAAGQTLSAVHREGVDTVIRTRGAFVGGIESHARPVVWLYMPAVTGADLRYVVALGLQSQAVQDLLISFSRPPRIEGIVDRNGNFIARTLQYDERVGTPATRFVLGAIRSGSPQGFYRGVTHEGVESYSAYHISQLSGWSAHLAVSSASIDMPAAWSIVAASFAGLGGLLLGGFLVVLVLRDMSERRRAEETLRQSQKMEAIGQLTGGIAHDFNNLLTAVIGNLDIIRRRAGEERLQRLADSALEAARRGAKLSSQLLAFSRNQRMSVRPTDLGQLLRGMSGLLKQSVGPAVRVDVQIDPSARFAMSDPNELELALLNIAVNARDAMPTGGVLTIQSRRAEDVDRQLPPGEYIELAITDTGTGMSEEVRARAAEPFFTTKPVGQGTGLGVSQVHGVVRESGGSLIIDSELGRGTSIRLILPAAAEDAIAAGVDRRDSAPTVPKPHIDDTPRILVIDDDKLVRRFIVEGLRGLRYQVLDASRGEEGLQLLNGMRFDLLLVDFAMPEMNGAEVARAALAKQPDLQIVLISGYTDSAALEDALGNVRQLRKPFDLAELGAAVAAVLSTAKQATTEAQES